MTARYLLDTNICIFIRRNGVSAVFEKFQTQPSGSAAMSVVTYGELAYGVTKSRLGKVALANLDALLSSIEVLALPKSAGLHYGSVRADLERRGEIISSNDLWIAAHAMADGLVLVTNNEREFRRVPGLTIENWAAAG